MLVAAAAADAPLVYRPVCCVPEHTAICDALGVAPSRVISITGLDDDDVIALSDDFPRSPLGFVQCVKYGGGGGAALPPSRLKRKRDANIERRSKHKELRERLEKEVIEDRQMHTRDIAVFFKK